jgi:hypothetical protein
MCAHVYAFGFLSLFQMTMQATYQNAFEDSQKDDMKREEEPIVVDLMPPQYQLSTPSPPSPTSVNAQRTPDSINDNGKFHIRINSHSAIK